MEYLTNGQTILNSDNRGNNQSSDDFDFTDILYKFLSYWRLILIVLIVSLALAYLYLQYAVPSYAVSSVILVKDDKKTTAESNIIESLDMFGSQKNVENEIEILRSAGLMEQVANNLLLYAPVSYQGNIRSLSAYTSSPIKVVARHPHDVTEVKKVDFSINKDNSITIANKTVHLNEWFIFNSDTLKFVNNSNYKRPDIESPLFFSLINVKRVAEDLTNNIVIDASNKQSTAISLNLKAPVPQEGEDILNELIRVYTKAGIEDKNMLASNTLSFVEKRLGYISNELDSVESAVQSFKTKNGIVDIGEQGKNFLQSVENNDEKVGQLDMQLAELGQVEQYVKSKENMTGIVPSALGLNDVVLTQLLQNLYNLEIEHERLRKTTAENNPLLISVRDQINKIKPSILENINSQRNSLLAGRNNLSSTSDRYSSLLKKIPQNERQLLEITRQQVIKNNIYTFLLEKREEAALSFASTVGDSRIVDGAVSSIDPVSPKKIVVFAIAILLGLGGSIAFIYFKEMLNRKVVLKSEIKKLVSWPLIGEIAHAPFNNKLVLSNQNSLVANQFRQLRTSLAYLGINKEQKKILITSSITGEGKTFVAANLATSLALTNKKVVLIELDLRSPKLHKIFNSQKDTGITNYLSGQAQATEIIEKTITNENLFLINSGPIPSNPSELILNTKMSELIQYLEKEFDYIIINTAPILPVTDAYVLSQFCDATLFIVRYDYTSKDHLKKIEENNQILGLKNVGIIFNGLKGTQYLKNGYGYLTYNNSGSKKLLKGIPEKSEKSFL